jgi:hypothetical protein
MRNGMQRRAANKASARLVAGNYPMTGEEEHDVSNKVVGLVFGNRGRALIDCEPGSRGR